MEMTYRKAIGNCQQKPGKKRTPLHILEGRRKLAENQGSSLPIDMAFSPLV
jgi:hypothetical protein